jgi:hypothetical protein
MSGLRSTRCCPSRLVLFVVLRSDIEVLPLCVNTTANTNVWFQKYTSYISMGHTITADDAFKVELVFKIYSRVSFCDGSFYDDSLLRRLLSRTEHSRLVVYNCRNSNVLSLFNALLALFRCACVSSFSILVHFF